MAKWINRFRMIDGEYGAVGSVVREFECSCSPDSRSHERMVMGALRNIGDHCYLEDGIPLEESSPVSNARRLDRDEETAALERFRPMEGK